MYTAFFRVLTVLAVATCVALVGCGGGVERADVYGTVTYQGEPVEEGTISFEPKDKGPLVATNITEGEYQLKGDRGVPPGSYHVKISSTVEDTEAFEEGMGPEPPRKEVLPEKYNIATELTLDVPSGEGSLEKNFDLE